MSPLRGHRGRRKTGTRLTPALLFGFFELIAGITLITRGIEVRRPGKTLHSVLPQATKAA